jgi:hypothetical protein
MARVTRELWGSCLPVRERPFPLFRLCSSARVPDDFREGGRRVERGRMASSFDLAELHGRDHPGERLGEAHDGVDSNRHSILNRDEGMRVEWDADGLKSLTKQVGRQAAWLDISSTPCRGPA